MGIQTPEIFFAIRGTPVVCALVLAAAISAAAGQSPAAADVGAGSHERQIARVRSAATGEYARALADYDGYLAAYPDDVIVAVEQCRFIERFRYDEDESLARVARDDFDRCVDALASGRQADEPVARLFVLDQQWGEEGIAAGEALVSASGSWPPHLRGRLHARLAFLYNWLGDDWPLLIAGHWSLRRTFWAAAILVMAVRVIGSLLMSPDGIGALGSDTTRAMQGLHAEYGVLVLLLVAAVIMPVVEEVLFRGVLLNGLARHVWFPAAAVIQAFVFASLHEGSPHLPLIFGMGLAAAWLYRRSGGLIAPIALHVFNNALACIAIVRVTGALGAGAP